MDAKLEAFLAVCEEKSFTKAASKLDLTQPAVSQHIKQLEADYGVKLFNRRNNEMVLTNEGKILYKYAEKIQNLYFELEKKIRDTSNNRNGLVVGVTHTSESNIAPDIFAEYASRHVDTHLRIISDSTKNLFDKLSDYLIDLAIIEGQVAPKKFSSILLGKDSLVAVLSINHPLAGQSHITLEELKKEKLILRSLESDTTNLFVSELEKLNISIDDFVISLETDNVASIKDLVRQNYGVSILPKSACMREVKEGTLKLLDIHDLKLVRETFLVYLKDNIDQEILNDIALIYREKIVD